MQRLTLFLILLLFIPDTYIYYLYIRKKTKRIWLRTIHWIPTLLLAGGYLCFINGIDKGLIADYLPLIGKFVLCIFLFSIPKIIFMGCSLIGLPFHYWLHFPRAPFTTTGVLVGGACFLSILYGTFKGITRFDVKEVEFYHPHLPAGFDNYRIVQLSDIHIGNWDGKEEAIQQMVELINVQNPDLIVFTGDLVNLRSLELTSFQHILSQLQAKDGVYSVLGNHDYGSYYHWESRKEQVQNLENLIYRKKAMGWKLLNNEHTLLHHQGDSIALIGVENDGEPPFSQFANLSKAAAGTEDMFRILLSHNPTHWRREVLPNTSIELTLAGHTHAMQAILFGHSFSSLIYPEWAGMYTEKEQALYVNIGIGYVGIPFRFGAWPEITVIKLRSPNK